jgi:hypothetical protein
MRDRPPLWLILAGLLAGLVVTLMYLGNMSFTPIPATTRPGHHSTCCQNDASGSPGLSVAIPDRRPGHPDDQQRSADQGLGAVVAGQLLSVLSDLAAPGPRTAATSAVARRRQASSQFQNDGATRPRNHLTCARCV